MKIFKVLGFGASYIRDLTVSWNVVADLIKLLPSLAGLNYTCHDEFLFDTSHPSAAYMRQ